MVMVRDSDDAFIGSSLTIYLPLVFGTAFLVRPAKLSVTSSLWSALPLIGTSTPRCRTILLLIIFGNTTSAIADVVMPSTNP